MRAQRAKSRDNGVSSMSKHRREHGWVSTVRDERLGLLALGCMLYVKLKNTDGGGFPRLSSLIIL